MRSHSQEAKTIPSQGIGPGSSPGGTILPPRAVYGDLAEWLIATVLKTVNRATGSRVRIPESPFWSYGREVDAAFLLRKHPGNRIEGSNPSAIAFCGHGEIGRRIGFKPRRWKPCRFESDCPHETKKEETKNRLLFSVPTYWRGLASFFGSSFVAEACRFFRFPLNGGDIPLICSIASLRETDKPVSRA